MNTLNVHAQGPTSWGEHPYTATVVYVASEGSRAVTLRGTGGADTLAGAVRRAYYQLLVDWTEQLPSWLVELAQTIGAQVEA